VTEPWRDQIAQMGLKKAGGGFNPYAAGPKQYGITGRPQATQGPLDSAQAQQGYQDRDQEQRARRQAVLSRMQAAQNGNYMSPNYLWGVK
jgi:hypothetical protein